MPSQTKLDESQLSVVALPPTPAKQDTKETKESSKDSAKVSPAPSSSSDDDQAVSSQILPLHRLSGSSLPRPHTQAAGQAGGQGGGQAGGQAGSSLPYSQTSHSALAQQVLTRNKPVAEVSPFSNIKVTDLND